ncbi:MAG: tetratricopeptide repeat protein [Pseudomonadota bacterium]
MKFIRLVFLAAFSATLFPALSYADTTAANAAGNEALAPPVEPQVNTSLSGLFLAATLAETSRDIPSAATFYRQAYEREPESDRFLQSAFTMELADGRMASALDLAAILVESGDVGMARLTLALDAVRQRSYRAAQRELEAYRTDGFGDLVAELIMAWVEFGNDEVNPALARLAALDGPGWVTVYADYHGGLIRLASGDIEGAVESLERAYTADPGALRLTQGYVRALIASDRIDEARAVFEQFLQAAPNNSVVRADAEALETAEPLEHRVVTPQQGIAEVFYGLGLAIGQEGAEEVGAIYLNLALFTDPDHDLGRFALARVYERLELWSRAVEVYELIGHTHPLKRTSETRLGLLLDELGRPDEADLHLEALIEANSSDLDAINTYGTVLRFRSDFEKAVEIYTVGIQTLDEPTREHWRLFYQRGIAYERTDRWPLAEADFLKALELFEDQPDVLNYLAYTWVDRGEHLERSVSMLERAAEMRPDSGYIVDSLGWVYFRLGRFEEAVEQLELAVTLDPTQAVIHDHLGDAYWMVGRRLEARFQWIHARDLEDDEIDAEAIVRKLQRGLTRDEVEEVGVWPEGYRIPAVQ